MTRDDLLFRLESAEGPELEVLLREGDPAILADYFGSQWPEIQRLAAPHRGPAALKLGNVVVIHGILGSHLAVGSRTIWLNPLSLLLGRFDQLRPGAAAIQPQGLLKRYYGKQLLTLGRRWNVRGFAYDWRLTLDESAAALAVFVDANFPNQPVHLVAHSMGGLVARAFLALRPHHQGRLIQLGTPNRGSYAIPQLLHGMHSLLTPLAALDLQHSRDEILAIIRSWPGVHAMDPANPALAALPIHPARTTYIAGSNRRTAVAICNSSRLGIASGYEWSPAGDGTVPHSLGLLDGVATYFADEEHGALPSNDLVLAAVDDILETGATQRLSCQPILHRGDASIPSNELAGFLSAPRPVAKPIPQLSVVAANLTGATNTDAILLGHYEGVPPLLADSHPILRELDAVLPTRLGEPFVIPATASARVDAPALLLIGLGQPGRLGEPELRRFVSRAHWAARQFGFHRLATTLIGSGAGNLPLETAAATWREESSGEIALTFYEQDPTRAARLAQILDSPAPLDASSSPLPATDIAPAFNRPARFSIERSPTGYRVALITDAASIPEREIPIDHSLIDEINGQLPCASDATEWAECLRLLILPHELRRAAHHTGPVVVACDRASAQLHWEHLHAHVSRQFRSLRAPFDRQRHALHRILIVADTCADAPLAGAASEAHALARHLSALGLEITTLIGPAEATRARVLRELLLRPYDALHFAGHCTFNRADPAASGWVFTDGALLSAREFARLDHPPAFLFSNACESGIIPPAAAVPSFAEVLLGFGVEHLIATARPVGDQAAEAFALAFWRHAHTPVWQALAQARHAAGPEAPSWQHYGDPAATLLMPKSSKQLQ